MLKFSYTSINSKGKGFSGTVEAPDINTAAATLRGQGKIITSLKERGDLAKGSEASFLISPLDRISFIKNSDIVMMFHQFAALIPAGVTISHSLEVLNRQAKKRRLKRLFTQISQDIEEGSTFASALKGNPKVFTPFITSMIEAGEAGGTLDIVLERIAGYLEEQAAFRAQLIISFIYPVIVIIMSVIVVGFLTGFVIPKFMPFITARGKSLPWNTQFLFDSTYWLRSHWKFMAAAVTGAVVGVYLLSRFEIVKYWLDRIKIKLPVIGPIFLYSVVVQFSRNLASLLTSGVDILVALKTVRNTLGNQAAMEVMDTLERRIIEGKGLSTSLREASFIFPPMAAEMVGVGEATGALDNSLNLVAQIHERLLRAYVKRMNSLIEPVLILTLGGIVGFVAWSLIAGVLTMYGI